MLLDPTDFQFMMEVDLFIAGGNDGSWYAASPRLGIIVKDDNDAKVIQKFWEATKLVISGYSANAESKNA